MSTLACAVCMAMQAQISSLVGPILCLDTLPEAADPAACREAYCTTGYSPILAFNVDDLQSTLVRCLEQGATMDGSIQHSPHGKASCAVAPLDLVH